MAYGLWQKETVLDASGAVNLEMNLEQSIC